jgi:hypothetical protein
MAVNMEKDALDDLLSTPLAAVADDGFSARVMVRAGKRQWRASILYYAALVGCALAAIFFMPLAALGDAIARIALMVAGSFPLSIAVAAIILTLSLEQWRREH